VAMNLIAEYKISARSLEETK